tara:strand:- start:859 stop:1227 length:369 start_codon:yes stop_codon:yes gene_type:complete
MTTIGYLIPADTGQGEELHGEVRTLQLQQKIKLLPNPNKTNKDAPDFIISALCFNGGDIQIGAAWRKTKDKIGAPPVHFISLSMDDPSFPNPLNVAAFKADDGRYEITWRRRQAQQNQNDAA